MDIVTQILNFGLPAPIDVQIVGRNLAANRDFAEKLLNQMKFIPGAVDLRIQQPFNYPKFHIDVDRTKSEQAGFTEQSREQPANLPERKFSDRAYVLVRPQTGVSYTVDFADTSIRYCDSCRTWRTFR